ncbi:MAG: hypothetical protein EOM14_15050, partial [Clostridia bacterium]|nr:hypothetical protein [Clostridia bacterium]
MHEDDNNRRSEWYTSTNSDTSPDRHTLSGPADETHSPEESDPPLNTAGRPPSFAEPYWSAKEQESKKSHRGAVRTISICLFVLVLIIASALIFTDRGGTVDIQLGDWAYHSGEELPEYSDDNYDDDFRAFFDDYYTEDDTITGENAIPKAETGTGVTLQFSPPSENGEMTLQEVYLKCMPSVVSITADVDEESYYWGSGVILTEDGYIITNTHVLDGTNKVTVTLW